MDALQAARDEWETNTTACHRLHRLGKWEEEFRRYGNSEAWLEWDKSEKTIEIKKIETAREFQGQGAATKLVKFVKSLADKHHLSIFGNAVAYDPDRNIPPVDLKEEQVKLETWYEKLGFQVYRSEDTPTMIWYPQRPV